eukprot:CAMPEP_0176165594 /NCGR_PEP_ID=MMETSP0120_2-20121206/84696_1 /TAXON_ID=160619 /ORGANISM="Kryptoperidinium foliaceum, Strain CCMP 1326" /LENGTH=78 /DNA_ID=CAMNT_0017503125 /DNA_START=664 /DNA_END=900 /DNA_ORIENTATION=+
MANDDVAMQRLLREIPDACVRRGPTNAVERARAISLVGVVLVQLFLAKEMWAQDVLCEVALFGKIRAKALCARECVDQ